MSTMSNYHDSQTVPHSVAERPACLDVLREHTEAAKVTPVVQDLADLPVSPKENPLMKYDDPNELKIVVGGKAYKPSEAPSPSASEMNEAREAADAMWKTAADANKSRN
jgi:hypothetical protein